MNDYLPTNNQLNFENTSPIHITLTSTIYALQNRLFSLNDQLYYYDHLINSNRYDVDYPPYQQIFDERDHIFELIFETEDSISLLRYLYTVYPIRPDTIIVHNE